MSYHLGPAEPGRQPRQVIYESQRHRPGPWILNQPTQTAHLAMLQGLQGWGGVCVKDKLDDFFDNIEQLSDFTTAMSWKYAIRHILSCVVQRWCMSNGVFHIQDFPASLIIKERVEGFNAENVSSMGSDGHL